jgi:hypothetical protein
MTRIFKILLASGEYDAIMDRPSDAEVSMAIDAMLTELALKVEGEY